MTNNILRGVVASLLLGQAVAHTWIEQLSAVSQNGTFIGDYGYPRGYLSRTDPGFNGGASSQWLLPPLDTGRLRINGGDLLCRPEQQAQKQSADWPRLQVAPGDFVAMKYAENGHVTLPHNQLGKPEKGGTVFIYGTLEPKEDEKIMNVLKWTEDGTGGDKRGKLLTAGNFDDGRCYQINTSPISTNRQKEFPDPIPGQPGTVSEQWCETDVQIPTDQAKGKTYTLYWVWQWPTKAGADPTYPEGKDEWYTTCSDVDIVADSGVKSFVADSSQQKYTLAQQDPQTKAVSTYMSRTALTTDPWIAMVTATTSSSVAGATPLTSSLPATPLTSSPAATIATSTASSSSSFSTSSTTVAASNPAGDGAADGASSTVYVTVTAPPSSTDLVTQIVTVTAEMAVVTTLQTTTMTVGATALRRSFEIRPERRQGQGTSYLNLVDERVAKEAYCKANAWDTQSCGTDESQTEQQTQTHTNAASPAGAAPSLLTMACIMFSFFAYTFA